MDKEQIKQRLAEKLQQMAEGLKQERIAAFKLLDQYNNPKTSETQQERIITQLYTAGYVIRPLNTIIIKDEVHAEHLNPGSKEWGLVDRTTGRPIIRPED